MPDTMLRGQIHIGHVCHTYYSYLHKQLIFKVSSKFKDYESYGREHLSFTLLRQVEALLGFTTFVDTCSLLCMLLLRLPLMVTPN